MKWVKVNERLYVNLENVAAIRLEEVRIRGVRGYRWRFILNDLARGKEDRVSSVYSEIFYYNSKAMEWFEKNIAPYLE